MLGLLKLAEELGLVVVEQRGRGSDRSCYSPEARTIRLTPRMSGRTARSVLAHEIAHHVLGHQPTPYGPLRARQERGANEWAARHLIALNCYIEVERLRDGHVPSMACDLDVAPELVIAYQGILEREQCRQLLERL